MDPLMEIARRPWAKSLFERLPLPVALPPVLERLSSPWEERPLEGRAVLVESPDSSLGELVRGAGASIETSGKWHGIVIDGRAISGAPELHSVYEILNRNLSRLGRGGRVILLGLRPDQGVEVGAAAAQEALSGLVRSLAKEIGKRGATSQLIYLPSAEDAIQRLAGPLGFFLSARSAYVSGQVLSLSAEVPSPASLKVPSILPLRGKRAIITGAARGIGASMAAAFAREGATVLGIDHPSQREALKATMSRLDGIAEARDLGDSSSFSAIAEKVSGLWGKVDILVNNAGITRDKTIARMPAESWDAVLRVNLEAPYRLTTELCDRLAEGGRVLFLSSVVGLAGNYGQTNYSAAKAGLVGLVRQLSPRLAPRGITVNAIAPGFIETPMTANIPLVLREMSRRLNSLKQAGLPADIAECATFLASPGAYAVTGATLRVCGQSLVGA